MPSVTHPTPIPQSNIPTCIQELLATTKDLQAVLEDWSHNRASETLVSDIYVRFGTQFNATVDAFSECNIDTRYVVIPSPSSSYPPFTSTIP
jgi:hypothetical protein